MNWTREEVILIVNDYFDMFKMELDSMPYNKAEHRRKLTPLLNNRDNSIEFKHQNISGVLANMGLPYIKGYKPLFRYQQLLEDEVVIFLKNNKFFFEKEFKKFADEKVVSKAKNINFEKVIDKKRPAKTKIIEKEPLFLPIKTNYLAREQNNRQLGEKGEQLVYDYEKWRLLQEGKSSLAEKVEWVSKEKGDGMGFDILSKKTNGKDMFIEVKTTKLAKETPIFFSRNEWKFAQIKGKDFFLYRVFNFSDNPQIFISAGSYESFCNLLPQTFKGYF
jgi:Domain of unknown function (DUF3883)